MKALTLCAGFGAVDIALTEIGFQVTAIEIDPAIAEVNRVNGGDVITADILDIDPANYIGYMIVHVSPPCPNFSLAKQWAAETDLDIALAEKINQFIIICQPRFFTMENVWLYRKSKSWAIILKALQDMGYGVDWWRLNAADYGIPQTRHRMIVVARRDGVQPQKPFPTHAKKHDMFTKPWVGWYGSIEDLIPDLPETQFASWQLDGLPKVLKTCLWMTYNTNRNGIDNTSGGGFLDVSQPSNAVMADTITANTNQTGVKAFICSSQNTSNSRIARDADEPYFTVVANCLEKNSPPKAFIVGGQYQSSNKSPNRIPQNRSCDRPIWTITASDNMDTRAWLSCGKVVAMTTRCLARFQGFPDWFTLPGDRKLACRGIGNAVPPGLYRVVLESLGLGGVK